MVAKKKVLLKSKEEDAIEIVKNTENGVTDINTNQKQWVAEAAYYFAEERSFMPGYEQEDWGKAEQEYKKQCC